MPTEEELHTLCEEVLDMLIETNAVRIYGGISSELESEGKEKYFTPELIEKVSEEIKKFMLRIYSSQNYSREMI